jgi:hypothetical protein
MKYKIWCEFSGRCRRHVKHQVPRDNGATFRKQSVCAKYKAVKCKSRRYFVILVAKYSVTYTLQETANRCEPRLLCFKFQVHGSVHQR